MKENLKPGEISLHVDCSENHVNKQQDEIQSTYFSHDSFSIFTTCCYLREPDGKLVNENVTVISEASDHLPIATFSCVNKVFNFACEKHNLPLKVTLHVWSYGCTGQFRFRYVFSLLSTIDRTVNLRWYYNKWHLSKGQWMVSEVPLRIEFTEMLCENKCVIKSAKEF